jgi:hypothetical protein
VPLVQKPEVPFEQNQEEVLRALDRALAPMQRATSLDPPPGNGVKRRSSELGSKPFQSDGGIPRRLRRPRSRQRHGRRQRELLEKSRTAVKDRHGARKKKNETKETGTGKLKEMSYLDLVRSNKARKTTQ